VRSVILTSAETTGWEWCDWIWELWQQHVQESSGSVEAVWSDTWASCDKDSCSSQAWSEQWTSGGGCFGIEVWTDTAKLTYMVLVISRFGDRSDLICEVFVAAKVLSRVGGIKWGVVDFGKLFTETSEQKFSLRGVQYQKICIWQQVLVLQKTTAFLFHKNDDSQWNMGKCPTKLATEEQKMSRWWRRWVKVAIWDAGSKCQRNMGKWWQKSDEIMQWQTMIAADTTPEWFCESDES